MDISLHVLASCRGLIAPFCLVGACRLGLPARVDPSLHSPVCPSGFTYGEIYTVGGGRASKIDTFEPPAAITISLTCPFALWVLQDISLHVLASCRGLIAPFCLVGACRLGLPARVDPSLRTGHSSPTWQCDLRNLQEVIEWAVMGILRISGHTLQDFPKRM